MTVLREVDSLKRTDWGSPIKKEFCLHMACRQPPDCLCMASGQPLDGLRLASSLKVAKSTLLWGTSLLSCPADFRFASTYNCRWRLLKINISLNLYIAININTDTIYPISLSCPKGLIYQESIRQIIIIPAVLSGVPTQDCLGHLLLFHSNFLSLCALPSWFSSTRSVTAPILI